jgi:selenium metabolism protein YedF
MSDSTRIVDARGQACPQPVILTRKALAEGGFDLLEVLVDDASSRDNVVRFATYTHCTVQDVREEEGASRILIRPSTAGQAAPGPRREFAKPDPAAVSAAMCAQGATVLIASAGIGTGDEQLGALLLRGFLHTLTEAEGLPSRIIFMNAGVRLAVEGSESLLALRKLAQQGVEILACGTCLEFYGLKDLLAVGRVTNLYEIAGFLLQGRTLSL